MCGAQQLQCKFESAPQIIGAYQPHQACNEYTHVHGFECKGGRGDTAVRTATLSEPRCLGTGALFLISESGRGRWHSY